MLKVRVIPTLLWKQLGLVKGVGFNSWRRVGPVLPAVKVYNARDVDELVFVDITASLERRAPDPELVAEFADECGVPLTVGGGIRTLEQIDALLHAGADKVALNSVLFEEPSLVERAANRFGCQCVMASLDVVVTPDGYRCATHAGTRVTDRDPVSMARDLVERGAGEILLTAVERDGTMTGYDVDLIAAVSPAVSVPVIASGGAGHYDHLIQAVRQGGASAVAAASIFHYTQQTPSEAKAAMLAAGIPVRQNFRIEGTA